MNLYDNWSPSYSAEEELRTLKRKHEKLEQNAKLIWEFLKNSSDFLARLRQPARSTRELEEKIACIEFHGAMENMPVTVANMPRKDVENYSQFIYRILMDIKD